MWNTVQYSRLPSDGPDNTLILTPSEKPDNQDSESARSSGLPLWVFLGCLICTLLNLFIVHNFIHVSNVRCGPPQYTTSLPRPNQYIGLDKVNRTGPGVKAPEPLVNYPPVLTQISSAKKSYIFPDEPHRWFSWVGTVSPDDRHFVVSKDVQTVAQFRVHDFGMDSCQVVINIPTAAELHTAHAPPKGAPGNKTSFSLEPGPVSVQVWKLKSISDLSVRTLSWNTRPPREELVATLEVKKGERAATQRFTCPSDSLQTFEFTCANGQTHCLIDFWQDKQEPMIAVILLQHSTVN